MRERVPGFRIDGTQGAPARGAPPHHFFYHADARHPGPEGHQALSELATYLVQQVRSTSHNAHTRRDGLFGNDS